MALWWTEGELRKLVLEVLASDIGKATARKHVESLLREKVATALGAEMSAAAEKLVENARASLLKKLNTIYASHSEKLSDRIAVLEKDLEAKAPGYQIRLDSLKSQIEELTGKYENWLEEPKKQLDLVFKTKSKAFSDNISRTIEKSRDSANSILDSSEDKLNGLIEERLHEIIVFAVQEHVTAKRFDHERLTNKQIAAAKGISLRAAKRLRQAATP